MGWSKRDKTCTDNVRVDSLKLGRTVQWTVSIEQEHKDAKGKVDKTDIKNMDRIGFIIPWP